MFGRSVVVALVVVGGACNSTDVEANPFNIAISGAVSSSFFSSSNDRYECHYRLVLISSGGGQEISGGGWMETSPGCLTRAAKTPNTKRWTTSWIFGARGGSETTRCWSQDFGSQRTP